MKSLSLRNSILILCFVLTSQLSGFSQFVPQGFFYQTELRTPARVIMPNQSVRFLFSIYATSISGTPVWEESHLLTSDDYGLVTTIIGSGVSTGFGSLSSFSQINWGATNYYVQVGAFKNELNGDLLQKKIQGLDLVENVGIANVYNNGLYRVKLGPYSSKKEADSSAAKIRKQLNIITLVINQ